jgi:hypothetical protein
MELWLAEYTGNPADLDETRRIFRTEDAAWEWIKQQVGLLRIEDPSASETEFEVEWFQA